MTVKELVRILSDLDQEEDIYITTFYDDGDELCGCLAYKNNVILTGEE